MGAQSSSRTVPGGSRGPNSDPGTKLGVKMRRAPNSAGQAPGCDHVPLQTARQASARVHGHGTAPLSVETLDFGTQTSQSSRLRAWTGVPRSSRAIGNDRDGTDTWLFETHPAKAESPGAWAAFRGRSSHPATTATGAGVPTRSWRRGGVGSSLAPGGARPEPTSMFSGKCDKNQPQNVSVGESWLPKHDLQGSQRSLYSEGGASMVTGRGQASASTETNMAKSLKTSHSPG